MEWYPHTRDGGTWAAGSLGVLPMSHLHRGRQGSAAVRDRAAVSTDRRHDTADKG